MPLASVQGMGWGGVPKGAGLPSAASCPEKGAAGGLSRRGAGGGEVQGLGHDRWISGS